MYSPLEENPDEVDYSEEFKMPDFAELSNLENWVHFNPYLLKVFIPLFSWGEPVTMLIPKFQKNRKRKSSQNWVKPIPKSKD
jgi:hypothetical protein